MTESPETKKILPLAKKILLQLEKSKTEYDQLHKTANSSYHIAGKTILEWRNYFKIDLPPDATTQTIQSIDSKLVRLYQEAYDYKTSAVTCVRGIKSERAASFRLRYAELVQKYEDKGGKLPAKDTLTALAEAATADSDEMLMHAEMALEFWKDTLTRLSSCRKLVQDVTINLSVEAKALNNEKYLNAINKDRNY